MAYELHAAISAGQIDQVKQLINSGADLEEISGNCTPLQWAIRLKANDIAKTLILAKANTNVVGIANSNLLYIAATFGNAAIIQDLVNASIPINAKDDGDGSTPLHIAAFYADRQTIDSLIAAGALINAKNNKGLTPLCYAIANKNKDCALALLRYDNVEVNFELEQKVTLLHNCVAFELYEVIQPLINAKISIDAQNANGHTALHYAVSKKCTDIIDILVSAGANRYIPLANEVAKFLKI